MLEPVKTYPDLILGLVFDVFHEGGMLTGFVGDPREPDKRWVVELTLDGWPVDVTFANLHDARTPDALGALDYGFAFDLRKFDFARAKGIEVKLANTDVLLSRLELPLTEVVERSASVGQVVWDGDVRFSGWFNADTLEDQIVRGLIDQDVVVEVHASGYRMIEHGAVQRARPVFEFHIPRRFADGKVRRLEVVDGQGRAFEGSPISFLAFEDGLLDYIDQTNEISSERIRGSVFDRMFPCSMPFDGIEEWVRLNPLPRCEADGPVALALIGDDDPVPTLESLAEGDLEIITGVIPSATRDGAFDPMDLLGFLIESAADCSQIVFALNGTTFEPNAIRCLAKTQRDTGQLVYGDVLVVENGRRYPAAFPDFDYERLLEQGYPIWLFAANADAVRAAVERGDSSLAALFLSILGSDLRQSTPAHQTGFCATLPNVDCAAASAKIAAAGLDHLQRRDVFASVIPLPVGNGSAAREWPRVHVLRRFTAETITIVVPSQDNHYQLTSCLDNLRAMSSRHPYELVLADMHSTEPAAVRLLDRLRADGSRVLHLTEFRNVARALNAGARAASTRFLLFLDPGVQLDDPHILDELISRCADPAVAAAGPIFVGADGAIEEGGLILDFQVGSVPVMRGHAPESNSYLGLLEVAHTRSALSAKCLLVRRDDHMEIGGFDERRFPNVFYHLDYGLRLRTAGKVQIVSPHARATWAAGKQLPSNPAAIETELAKLRAVWGEALASDPTYSMILATGPYPYTALLPKGRTARFHLDEKIR